MKDKLEIRRYSDINHSKTVEWLNNIELRESFGITYDVTQEGHKTFLINNPNIEFLALYRNDEYVGNIVLNNTERHLSTYLQIYLSPEAPKGVGLGTSFMNLALKYVFQEKMYHRIWLHVRENNIPARKLYLKLGFKDEGLERDAVLNGSKFISQLRMSILESEFKGAI